MNWTSLTYRWVASLVFLAGICACSDSETETDQRLIDDDPDEPMDDAAADDDAADDEMNDDDAADDEMNDDADGGFMVSDAGITPDQPAEDAGSDGERMQQFAFDFVDGAQGWEAGFSDFSADMQQQMDLVGGIVDANQSPENIGQAFTLQGSNSSDDLFMYMKKHFGPDDGVQPDTGYAVDFTVKFWSNARSDCIGIGGAPGESVFFKVGGSGQEPEAVLDADGDYRMNIDKGDQSNDGTQATVAGNIANGEPCEGGELGYQLVTRKQVHGPVLASEDGDLWLFVGTDSGFEGRTELYYQSIELEIGPLDVVDPI